MNRTLCLVIDFAKPLRIDLNVNVRIVADKELIEKKEAERLANELEGALKSAKPSDAQ